VPFSLKEIKDKRRVWHQFWFWLSPIAQKFRSSVLFVTFVSMSFNSQKGKGGELIERNIFSHSQASTVSKY